MGKPTRSTNGSNLKTAAAAAAAAENSAALGGAKTVTTPKKRKASTATGKTKTNSNNNNNNNIMDLPKFDPSAYKLDSDDSDDEELFQPSVFARKSIDNNDPAYAAAENNKTNLQQQSTTKTTATVSKEEPENDGGDANNPEEIEKQGRILLDLLALSNVPLLCRIYVILVVVILMTHFFAYPVMSVPPCFRKHSHARSAANRKDVS
jgi:hypothetical protein